MAPSKPNPHQRAAIKRANAGPALSGRSVYLIGYNLASAAAWGYVLFLGLSQVWPAVDYALEGYAKHGNKGWVAAGRDVGQMVVLKARGTFKHHGEVVKWVQTGALLEVVHAGVGLVRSSFVTTLAQVFSRFVVVWGVGHFFPQAAVSPIYLSMIVAWSLAEITRYLHYAAGLAGVKVAPLEWLRYSAFYILYPVGAGSEAWLLLRAAGPAGDQFGLPGRVAVYALAAIWPPALFVLMSHMTVQRRKYIGKAKASTSSAASGTKKSIAVAAFSPPAPAPEAEASGLKPAKVVTRRSSRQSLAPAATEAPKTPKKAAKAGGSPAGSGTDTPGRATRSRSKAL